MLCVCNFCSEVGDIANFHFTNCTSAHLSTFLDFHVHYALESFSYKIGTYVFLCTSIHIPTSHLVHLSKYLRILEKNDIAKQFLFSITTFNFAFSSCSLLLLHNNHRHALLSCPVHIYLFSMCGIVKALSKTHPVSPIIRRSDLPKTATC